jgi:uncharacterized protein with beta-barrel porin domain
VGIGGIGSARAGVRVTGGRLRLLLGSASVAALLLGSSVPSAIAGPCAINDLSNSLGAGPFNNTTNSINCINIQNSNVNGGTGNVSNTAPGVITTSSAAAPTGIRIDNSTLTGSVINSGAINATAQTAPNSVPIGIFITNNSSLAGGVTNSGAITATTSFGRGAGINAASGATISGTISNSGTITADLVGIELGASGSAVHSAAGVSNTGLITASNAAIDVGAVSNFTGGISNGGTLSATIGIIAGSFSTFSGGITNTATIATPGGSGVGIAIGTAVVGFGAQTFSGGVTNGGTISAGLGIQVQSLGNALTFTGGNISNNGAIIAQSGFFQTGIQVEAVSRFAASIVNSGNIAAGAVGIQVGAPNTALSNLGVSTFIGNIVNSGSITAKTGINVGNATMQGQIIVTGNVLATTHGILIGSASTIASTATAVQIFAPTFTGGVTNAGTITTSGASGIEVNSVKTFTGGIVNTGSIAAQTHALSVASVSTFAGGISNNGTLTATNSVILVSSVAVFGTIPTGGITNSGTITGGGGVAADINVLNVGAFDGGIVNGGSIGGGRTGISVSTVSSFAGGITNTAGGTISAGVFGIALSSVSTFTGNMSNAGTITAQTGIRIGAGVTFFGGAIINTGTITGTNAAIDVSGMTTAITILQAAGTLNGAVKLSTNIDVFDITGGIVNGNIVGAGTHDTVNFNPGAGNTFTYNSNFTGISHVNVLSGTVILNGANSATNVDVLGGTLAGAGSIDPVALTIHSGGTFAPGIPGSPGTSMSIVGTLTFQPGAIYQIYLNPSATTSATISGAVSLAGTVQANFAPGTYVNRSYDILHSGGLGGTTFNSLTVVPPNFDATLSYTSTDVFLNLTAGLGQGGGLTVNQQNVATALNTFFNNGGTLPPGFASIFALSGASLANALNQLNGELATGAERAAFQIESQFLGLLLDPFVYGRGDAFAGAHGGMSSFAPPDQPGLPSDVTLAYNGVLKAPPKALTFDQRWTAWGAAYGGQATAKGDPVVIGSTNVTTGTFGFAGGMDYRLSPNTVVGFALGGGGTNWGLEQGMGSGRSDTLQVGAYGATHQGRAYAAAAIAFANHWMTTNRTALGDALSADFSAQSYGVRLETGYRFPVMMSTATLGLAPYAAVQTQSLHTPSYSERDSLAAGLGLSYQAMTANDTRSELGVRVDDLAAFNGMPLMLRGRLAWAHDWVSNPSANAVFQSLPGTNFTVFGAPVAQNAALASAGAELRITPRLFLIGKFDGEFATGSQSYAGSGTLRYAW